VGDVLVKLRYEERDIARMVRSRALVALRARPQLPLALGVCLVVACLTTIYAPSTLARVVVGAVAVVIVILGVALLVVLPRIAFRRRLDLRAGLTIDASDEGLTVVTGQTAKTMAWSDCGRIEVSRRLIVIHHGEDAVVVPRRAFRDAERERAFLALLPKR